jgi:hypothetical protein
MVDTVQRLLVTGAEADLLAFHRSVYLTLNVIDQWGLTVFYTCLPEHYEAALRHAAEIGVTVQAWQDGDWPVVVPGLLPGWSAEQAPSDQEDTDDAD